AKEVLGALATRQRAPVAPEGLPRGANRLVDVLHRGARNLRDRLLSGRVDRREPLPATGGDFLATDEQPVPTLQLDDITRLWCGCVVPRDLLAVAQAPRVWLRCAAANIRRLAALDQCAGRTRAALLGCHGVSVHRPACGCQERSVTI